MESNIAGDKATALVGNSGNVGDFKKMGSSLLRHCRRRTQSEPPKNYKSGKLKQKVEKMRHSLDISQRLRQQQHQQQQASLEHSPLVKSNEQHFPNDSFLATTYNTLKCQPTNNTIEKTLTSICSKCSSNISHDTKTCFNISEKRYQSFDETAKQTQSLSTSTPTEQCHNKRCQHQDIENISDASPSPEVLPEEFHFIRSDEDSRSNNSRNEGFCFSKMICCRKGHRNGISCRNNINNNNERQYSYPVNEYLRIPQRSPSSTIDSESTCLSSLGSTTGNECSCPTISSTSGRSRTFSSDHSSANLSHDSGFDEPKCFINMIYQSHKCKGKYNCYKKEKASLNLHLKNLMNCMPKSFEDSESLSHVLTECSGASKCAPPFSMRRRNAICETSEEMRVKFYEALSAFMTLQAMAKYDFL